LLQKRTLFLILITLLSMVTLWKNPNEVNASPTTFFSDNFGTGDFSKWAVYETSGGCNRSIVNEDGVHGYVCEFNGSWTGCQYMTTDDKLGAATPSVLHFKCDFKVLEKPSSTGEWWYVCGGLSQYDYYGPDAGFGIGNSKYAAVILNRIYPAKFWGDMALDEWHQIDIYIDLQHDQIRYYLDNSLGRLEDVMVINASEFKHVGVEWQYGETPESGSYRIRFDNVLFDDATDSHTHFSGSGMTRCNAVANGGFETGDLTNWTHNDYAEATTAWSNSGSYSCKIRIQFAYTGWINQTVNIAVNDIGEFSAYNSGGTGDLLLTVTYNDGSSSNITAVATGYLNFTPYLQPSKNITSLNFAIHFGDYYYLDDVQILYGGYNLQIVSQPEINLQFTLSGLTYTTPCSLTVNEGSYTIIMVDIFKVVNGTAYYFVNWNVNATTDYYQSVITLSISGDTNATAICLVGAYRKPSPAVVPPEEMMHCFPFTFYIIMVVLFFGGLYLLAKRNLWMISIPLIPVILWLLLWKPCPPYDFYIVIILVVIAVGLVLNKLRRK